MYIEDFVRQQKQTRAGQNFNSERTSLHSQRFNWQTNPQMNQPFDIQGKTRQLRESTQGTWAKLVNQENSSQRQTYQRARSSTSFCKQAESQRVLVPELQVTPKFTSIKVFGKMENDNQAKRLDEKHQKKIEDKWKSSVNQYLENKDGNRLISDSYVVPVVSQIQSQIHSKSILNNKSDIFFQGQSGPAQRHPKKFFPQKSKIYFQNDYNNDKENTNNLNRPVQNSIFKTSSPLKDAIKGQIATKVEPQKRRPTIQEQKIFQSNFQFWENPNDNKRWNENQRAKQEQIRTARSSTYNQASSTPQVQQNNKQQANLGERKLDVSRIQRDNSSSHINRDLSSSKINYQNQMKSTIQIFQ